LCYNLKNFFYIIYYYVLNNPKKTFNQRTKWFRWFKSIILGWFRNYCKKKAYKKKSSEQLEILSKWVVLNGLYPNKKDIYILSLQTKLDE
jgi:hypothetical protein